MKKILYFMILPLILFSCLVPDSFQADFISKEDGLSFENDLESALPQTAIYDEVVEYMAAADTKKHKVLVCGWDGVRLDAMISASTPVLDEISSKNYVLFTGGEKPDNLQLTSSGPGWATILTGKWASEHGFKENGIEQKNSATPSFLKSVKESIGGVKVGSAVHWATINTNILKDELDLLDFHAEGLSDSATADKAVEFINDGVDVLFVQLDNPDAFGHGGGFTPYCPSYCASISAADKRLGSMVDTISSREKSENEQWLILVVTDHGGYGRDHGGQSYAERTVWMVSNR